RFHRGRAEPRLGAGGRGEGLVHRLDVAAPAPAGRPGGAADRGTPHALGAGPAVAARPGESLRGGPAQAHARSEGTFRRWPGARPAAAAAPRRAETRGRSPPRRDLAHHSCSGPSAKSAAYAFEVCLRLTRSIGPAPPTAGNLPPAKSAHRRFATITRSGKRC